MCVSAGKRWSVTDWEISHAYTERDHPTRWRSNTHPVPACLSQLDLDHVIMHNDTHAHTHRVTHTLPYSCFSHLLMVYTNRDCWEALSSCQGVRVYLEGWWWCWCWCRTRYRRLNTLRSPLIRNVLVTFVQLSSTSKQEWQRMKGGAIIYFMPNYYLSIMCIHNENRGS